MSKKDFKLLAVWLSGHINDGAKCFDSEEDCRAIAESLADVLKETNPLFDVEKFLKACGVADFKSYEDKE